MTATVTAMEFIRGHWAIGLCAFATTLIATPVCRVIARKYRIVDRPDDFLKPHKKPIPYLGGVAIFLGWAVGILVSLWATGQPVDSRMMYGVLAAGLLIMIVGLADDIRVMAPKPKLFLNLAAGGVLLIAGVGQHVFGIFVSATALRHDPIDPWVILVFSVPLSLFIIVGACNATNLIDGLDGLCSGVLGIISVGFFVLALHLATTLTTRPFGPERVILSLAMLGASLGFLPYNRNPATIFMGDAGSMLLGLNAAVLILLFCENDILLWMIASLIVFGLPIADMSLTLLRRWRNGKPVMIGDRSHFYDQLVDRGYTVKQVVAISYALAATFTIVGCGTAIFLRTRHAIVVYAAAALLVIVAVWKFRMVELMPPDQRGGPKNEH